MMIVIEINIYIFLYCLVECLKWKFFGYVTLNLSSLLLTNVEQNVKVRLDSMEFCLSIVTHQSNKQKHNIFFFFITVSKHIYIYATIAPS